MAIHLAERPVFIVGQERSGTTLLMAMLGCHSRIAVPEVAWWYPRFRGYLHTYGDLSDSRNFRVLAEEMIFALRIPFFGVPTNPRTIVDEVLADLPERSFAGIYSAMVGRYARWQNKPRWGEKTPNNVFFAKEILEDFPNAQFLCLTRDGRDVCADALDSDFGPTNALVAAEHWAFGQRTIRSLRAQLPQDAWMDVRYEDLARAPEAILRRVCDFLGEPFEERMLGFHTSDIARGRAKSRDHKALGEPANTRHIGIYREQLSARDQRIFVGIASDLLRAEGYEVEVEPLVLPESEQSRLRDLDGRIRTVTLELSASRLEMESYWDWLVERREARHARGIWSKNDVPQDGLPGHPYEEHIVGVRAPVEMKRHFSIRRQFDSGGGW